jgi:hypothetical protein
MLDEQSSEEFQLPAELAALEKQLAGFTPAAARVDRDRLMFAAGRAAIAGYSRPRWPGYIVEPSWLGSRFWPAATAMMTAATILLAATLLLQHDVDRIAAKPQAASDVDTTDNAFGDAPESNNNNEFVRFDASHSAWPWSARPTSGYLGLRYVALTQGVGAIGIRPAATSGVSDEPPPPATARELLEELLPAAGRASS